MASIVKLLPLPTEYKTIVFVQHAPTPTCAHHVSVSILSNIESSRDAKMANSLATFLRGPVRRSRIKILEILRGDSLLDLSSCRAAPADQPLSWLFLDAGQGPNCGEEADGLHPLTIMKAVGKFHVEAGGQ